MTDKRVEDGFGNARNDGERSALEILGRARQAQAIRILFLEGFDTYELAILIDRTEPEVVELLHADVFAPGRRRVNAPAALRADAGVNLAHGDEPGAPSLDDQILAAELWALGLKDWLERFAGGRKRSADEIDGKRRQYGVAQAVVATLRALQAAEAGKMAR